MVCFICLASTTKAKIRRRRWTFLVALLACVGFGILFIPGALAHSSARRSYAEDVDWVYHAAGAVLSPAQVQQAVQGLQRDGVRFTDTVPPSGLSSPCNL